MKLLGLVGSNADLSYNRDLLQYIQKEYVDLFDLEIFEIKDIPMFNQSQDLTESVLIQNLKRKILQSDGVIIATPEHNHTVPAGMKSVLEWLSFKIHPLQDKPVMIVGCSFFNAYYDTLKYVFPSRLLINGRISTGASVIQQDF